MRSRIMTVSALTLVLGVAASQGEARIMIDREAAAQERAVAQTGGLAFRDNLVPPLLTVPAGVFVMGDGVGYCGQQQHQVTLTRSLQLGQHEVTNQEYLDAVQWAYDHGYVTATTTSVQDNLDGSTQELCDLDGAGEIAFSAGTFTLMDAGEGINPDHPVMEVTWYGAARYCDWLSLEAELPRAYQHGGDWACNGGDPYGAPGYRLPTDAEWEFAAQYDDERIYPWGNQTADCSRANFYDYYITGDFCVGWTSPAGSYGQTGLGFSDLAGNVWEWCNDWFVCSLGTSPATDPPGPLTSNFRVVRGSSWWDYDHTLRCASRDGYYPGYSYYVAGFRVAKTAVPDDVDDPTTERIKDGLLFQNRPNPFTPVTRIAFELARPGRVELGIYDVDGHLIRVLIDEERAAGSHEVRWDGRDGEGKQVPGGVYFYRLTGPGIAQSRRMILTP